MTELADPNFGFNGPVPDGASIAENIRLGLEYQRTHTLVKQPYGFTTM